MRRTVLVLIVFFVCLSSVSLFAAEQAKPGEPYTCPRAVSVEVVIKTAGAVNGWDAMPARSTFTLAIKENAVRANSMICHYTNGTVDYNLTKAFPKGKICYLAPNQSFMCQ
jgi:hypothetical protein